MSVVVDGFHNDEGEAILSLFSGEGGFPDEMEKAVCNLRIKIDSGRVTALFADIPHGEYAMSVLHDEDGDRQMKSTWLGQPLEGFGFSGQPAYHFGPPEFSEAAFFLISESREIEIHMRYDTVRKNKQGDRRAAKDGQL